MGAVRKVEELVEPSVERPDPSENGGVVQWNDQWPCLLQKPHCLQAGQFSY